MTFGARLQEALATRGPLCVGIDPHAALLHTWGLSDDPRGLRDFGLQTVDAAAGRAGIVKPQVAFFERHGSAGLAVLEEIMAAARAAGLLVIADAKRGDIGTTMQGYSDAWLRAGAPLECDALTVSPYLGPESLAEVSGVAAAQAKGLFVLAATSNPDAGALQRAVVSSGEQVARSVTLQAVAADPTRGDALHSVGVVIGATVAREDYGLDDALLAGVPILAPGFGAQGAVAAELGALFGRLSPQVIANESRSLLAAGPDDLAATIAAAAHSYLEVRDA